MLSFALPWAFALVPLPLLVRWLAPPYRRPRTAVQVPFFQGLARASDREPGAGAVSRRRSLVQTGLFLLVWCALVTAAARPQWIEPPIVREQPTRDLLLLIDLSASMSARDFPTGDGETIERLEAVKQVLGDFLSRRKGDRVGIVLFGSAAYVQVPFTQDLEVCRQLLDQTAVGMAGPRTVLGDAIGLGINLFRRSTVKKKVMIALTDGNDTGSLVPPVEASRIAAGDGIVIHTVAIGDPTSVGEQKLDVATLKAVAANTGGRYFFAADRDSLEGIYAELDRIETRKVKTVSYRPRLDLFFWPLGLALVLVLLYHLVLMLRSLLRRPSSGESPVETPS